MATLTVEQQVQQIYIGLLGRAADKAGLDYWTNEITTNVLSIEQLRANIVNEQPEYTAGLGSLSRAQVVAELYQNLFERAAESVGLQYWISGDGASVNVDQLVLALSNAAGAGDRVTLDNKTEAATYYAANVGTGFTRDGAKAVVADVDGTRASVLDSKSATDGGTQDSGSTFTLTAGVDSPTAGAANDTFVAVVDAATPANTTLTAVDTVNGAGGDDTLKIITQGLAVAAFNVTGAASVSNVETVEIRAVHTGGSTADFVGTSAPGVTLVNNNLSTAGVTLTDLADTTAIKVTGNGVTDNGSTTATYVAAATSGELTVDGGVTDGAIAVNGAGLTSLAITSSGVANTTGAISTAGTPTAVTIAAATALTTTGLTVGTNAAAQSLTISGAGIVTLGTLDDDFATVNATANSGGVVATLNGLVTGTTTGGTGADSFTTGAVLTTGSVNAGDGTDTLTVADTTHLATAVLGAKYTNFETLGVINSVSVDLDNIAGITSVVMTDGNGTTALTDLSATQAGAVTIRAGDAGATIGVKDAATVGQIDTVKMTFNDGNTTLNQDINVNASTFTLAAVENLEVTAVDQVAIVQSNTASGDLTGVKLSGAGNISFVTGNMDQVNFSLDASASTGTNALDASAFATNGVAISGGTGVDTITGSGQADSINGGAGADVITSGDGTDSVTGGDGADTFAFALLDNAGADGAAVADIIADFAAGTDKLQFTNFADVVSGQQAAVQAAVTALTAGSTEAQIATAMANANTTDLGVSFAVFEGNTYAYAETTGATTTHVEAGNIFVELSGVTTVPTFAVDVVA